MVRGLRNCRAGATLENDSAIQHAMPQLPEGYVPDVATVQAICDTLRKVEKSVQVVQIVGGPGQGNLRRVFKSVQK